MGTETLTAPEAADPISRICAVYLLVLSCRCPARPRSFRVYSGSWSVQPADRPLRPWTTALWRCRDCGTLRYKAMISRTPSALWGKNSGPTQPNTDLHSVLPSRARCEICIPSFVTRLAKLPPKRCGTPFATLRHGRSRLKSVMTLSNSDCACGTMEKALIQQFFPAKAVRDTSACPGCGNVPLLSEVSWWCGAKSMLARK